MLSLRAFMKTKKEKKINEIDNNIENLFNFTYLKDGIIKGKNCYVTFLEVLPSNFKLKSEDERNFIIKRYSELLKTVKCEFSTFTISRKGSIEKQINHLDDLILSEKCESVKELTKIYKEFLKDTAKRKAIKKRFIIAIYLYEEKGRNINFDDAYMYLIGKKTVFEAGFEKCTNEIVKVHDRDLKEFTLEIMRELIELKEVI